MVFDIFRKRNVLQSVHAYSLTPVALIKYEANQSGIVTLLIPKFNNQRISKALEKRNRHLRMHLELDAMGSFVWKNINSNTNIGSIIDDFKKIFPHTELAEERIITFITKMYHEKWLTFKELEK